MLVKNALIIAKLHHGPYRDLTGALTRNNTFQVGFMYYLLLLLVNYKKILLELETF